MSETERSTTLYRMMKEFKTRRSNAQFGNAIRLSGAINDLELVRATLAADLVRHLRKNGMKLKTVELRTTGPDDYGRTCALGYKAEVKKDPEASAIVMISETYSRMLAELDQQRGGLVDLLLSCLRSKSIVGVRKKIAAARLKELI